MVKITDIQKNSGRLVPSESPYRARARENSRLNGIE
jgi:hypothetical protein